MHHSEQTPSPTGKARDSIKPLGESQPHHNLGTCSAATSSTESLNSVQLPEPNPRERLFSSIPAVPPPPSCYGALVVPSKCIPIQVAIWSVTIVPTHLSTSPHSNPWPAFRPFLPRACLHPRFYDSCRSPFDSYPGIDLQRLSQRFTIAS
jgi:hypothetical protein